MTLNEFEKAIREGNVIPIKIHFNCGNIEPCKKFLPYYQNSIVFMLKKDLLQCNSEDCPSSFDDGVVADAGEYLYWQALKTWDETIIKIEKIHNKKTKPDAFYKMFFDGFYEKFVKNSINVSKMQGFTKSLDEAIDKYVSVFYFTTLLYM